MRKIELDLLKYYKWVSIDSHITIQKRKSINEIYCKEVSFDDSSENKQKVPSQFSMSYCYMNVPG